MRDQGWAKVERGIFKRGRRYWIRYGYRGQDRREPAPGETLKAARDFRTARLEEIRVGRYRPDAETLTLRGLLDGYLAAGAREGLQASSLKAYGSVQRRLLVDWGAEWLVSEIRPLLVGQYVDRSLAAGLARSTVNRHVSLLRAALRWAERQELIARAPRIAGVGGHRPKQGFLEPEDFARLIARFEPDDADAARFLYLTGRRFEEALRLEWHQVTGQEIVWARLKNGDGLTLPIAAGLREVIQRRRERRVLGTRIIPLVFHRRGFSLRQTFRGRWRLAVAGTEWEAIRPHDFRRSALRNLIRAGVTETVAMAISGHRSRRVFSDYNITSTEDTRRALEAVARYASDRTQTAQGAR